MADPKPHLDLEEARSIARKRAQQTNREVYIMQKDSSYFVTRVLKGEYLECIKPPNRKLQRPHDTFITSDEVRTAVEVIDNLTTDNITLTLLKPRELSEGHNYSVTLALPPQRFEVRFASTLLAKVRREGIGWYVFDNGIIIEDGAEFKAVEVING